MIGVDVKSGVDRLAAEKPDILTGLPHQIISGTISGDSAMRKIPLTQGKFVLIDNEDYKRVSLYKWQYCLVGKYRDREVAMWRGGEKGKRRTIIMSRYIVNAPKGLVVDHIDGNPLNNKRNNLRICTNQQNTFNQGLRKLKRKTSQFKGVYYRKNTKRWSAGITHNSKKHSLGCFDSEVDAARAYDKKAKELFGEFARLNNVQRHKPIPEGFAGAGVPE